MSDYRRANSRMNNAIPQHQIISNSINTENQESRRRRMPRSTSDLATKRTFVEKVSSRTTNSKRRKDLSDDDIEEIPANKKVTLNRTPAELDRCAICLDDCEDPKQLNKCTHVFCRSCIDHYFQTVKPQCPCCFTIYGEIRGNQPVNGTMAIETSKHRLPGFEHDSRGTIRITYHFPNGIQDENHPNPGMPYHGTTRHAFLPDNSEGRHILELLQRAFRLRQIFTVGQSRTTGYDNVITWNDIHHKTNINGGAENFGYPDKTYLNRVRQELAAKGII